MNTTKIKTKVSLDTETTGKNPHNAGLLLISGSDKTYSFVHEFNESIVNPPSLLTHLREFLVLQNGKYDKIVLAKHGINIDVDWDTMVAEYLLNIDKSVKLEEVYERYTGVYKEGLMEVYNRFTSQDRKTLPDGWYTQIDQTAFKEYAVADAEATLKIQEFQEKEFQKRPELYSWFKEVEMPLVNILAEVELKGVKVNIEKLRHLEEEFEVKKNKILGDLKFIAGKPDLNFNSSKQLQEVLYHELKLPTVRKTKTGFSTDSATLKKLAERHAFPKFLLEYRTIEKILGTYIKPIQEQVDENGRLHTNYNQCLTKTRRFSSDSPNLQNIPVKSELGRLVKESFVPEAGHKFLIADYDQVELRILAHLSQDKTLIQAFNEGIDVHQQTADLMSKKLGRPIDRGMGKTLNFSIVYGKTAYGFAEDWGCTESEAQEIIDGFFEARKGMKEYIEDIKNEAIRTGGWLNTLAGLPLFVGDTRTNNKFDFSHAMRCAVDYPIQGSSQDVLKKAIVHINRQLGLSPVLMVHDEVVYELKDINVEVHTNEIIRIMESVFKLSVPLKVSYKISDRWEK